METLHKARRQGKKTLKIAIDHRLPHDAPTFVISYNPPSALSWHPATYSDHGPEKEGIACQYQ